MKTKNENENNYHKRIVKYPILYSTYTRQFQYIYLLSALSDKQIDDHKNDYDDDDDDGEKHTPPLATRSANASSFETYSSLTIRFQF